MVWKLVVSLTRLLHLQPLSAPWTMSYMLKYRAALWPFLWLNALVFYHVWHSPCSSKFNLLFFFLVMLFYDSRAKICKLLIRSSLLAHKKKLLWMHMHFHKIFLPFPDHPAFHQVFITFLFFCFRYWSKCHQTKTWIPAQKFSSFTTVCIKPNGTKIIWKKPKF